MIIFVYIFKFVTILALTQVTVTAINVLKCCIVFVHVVKINCFTRFFFVILNSTIEHYLHNSSGKLYFDMMYAFIIIEIVTYIIINTTGLGGAQSNKENNVHYNFTLSY